MNPTPSLLRRAVIYPVSFASFFAVSVHGADGTWINTAGGLWSSGANWALVSGSPVIANDAGSAAYFNTLDITAATTVNLDSARVIGALYFGDTLTGTGTNGSWTLANNGNAANTLTLGGAATITIDAMAAMNNTNSNVTISAVIAGTNGLTVNGTGVNSVNSGNNTQSTGLLTLSGANTYTGATNIAAGTLRVTNASAFGGVADGKLATNVVNVASGARLTLSGVNIANTVNLNGNAGSPTVSALAVTGGNATLSGIVNVESNALAYVHNGGNYTLTFSGALNLGSNVFTIQTTGDSNGALITGTVTGSGGITKSGAGPLTMSGDGSAYSGTTTLNAGELRLGSDNALGSGVLTINPGNNAVTTIRSTAADTERSVAAAVTIGNGISSRYAFGSTATATGNLKFTNTTDIGIAGVKLFEVHNRTQFDAGFTGTGGITMQTGTGVLLFNGTNTYAGSTTINSGTLLVNGSLLASPVVVNSGGRIGGTGSVGNVTFNTGASLAYEVATAGQGGDGLTTTGFSGTGVGGFTIYLSGAATGFDASSNYTWAVLSSNSTDIAGIVLSNIVLNTSGFGQAFTGSFNLSKDVGSIYVNYVGSAIPEPSAFALLAGVAFLGFAVTRRRRA